MKHHAPLLVAYAQCELLLVQLASSVNTSARLCDVFLRSILSSLRGRAAVAATLPGPHSVRWLTFRGLPLFSQVSPKGLAALMATLSGYIAFRLAISFSVPATLPPVLGWPLFILCVPLTACPPARLPACPPACLPACLLGKAAAKTCEYRGHLNIPAHPRNVPTRTSAIITAVSTTKPQPQSPTFATLNIITTHTTYTHNHTPLCQHNTASKFHPVSHCSLTIRVCPWMVTERLPATNCSMREAAGSCPLWA